MNRGKTTLATWAAAIWDTLESMDLNPDEVFGPEQLKLTDLTDAEARISVEKMASIWRRCVKVSGREAFGLEVPEFRSLLTFHGVGIALEASESLRDALDRLVKLSHLVSDVADISYEETSLGHCVMRWHIEPAARDKVAHEAMDAFLYSWTKNLPAENLVEVLMVRPEPKNPEAWVDKFQAPVVFSARQDQIVFQSSALDKKIDASNPAVASAGEQVALDYLKRMSSCLLKVKVEAKIRSKLESGEPKQIEIAAALHISPRQLQRKLAQEGTSFVNILKEVRHQLAKQYLKDAERTVTDISLSLGFRDQSNFASAFKRWEGCSPSKFREQEQ